MNNDYDFKNNINWFPGHMKKTEGIIKENLKLCDIVIELLDARIPFSSKNPLIDEIINNKPRLIILNKCDMADDLVTESWIKYYKEKGIKVIKTDSLSGKGVNNVLNAVSEVLKDKIKKYKDQNLNYTVKMMIVGIPNVGKSSFINRFTNRSVAKSGDTPGVTKGKQWIRVAKGYELLDTPGILWHRFDNKEIGLNLAICGSIRDSITDNEELAFILIKYMKEFYPDNLKERYKIDFKKDTDAFSIMEEIGRKRGFLIRGGEIDTDRASNIIIDEFRSLKLGKISLERKNEFM